MKCQQKNCNNDTYDSKEKYCLRCQDLMLDAWYEQKEIEKEQGNELEAV